jgi:peptidoglycan/LPS O-acetylase OafA/YrhL
MVGEAQVPSSHPSDDAAGAPALQGSAGPISTASRPRIAELDALRGIAALGVVVYHLVTGYGYVYGHDFYSPPVIRFGAYGVHLFFIISGFVILMTIEYKARPRDFVIARMSRLYPTYWTAVLLTCAMVAAGALPDQTVTGKQVLVNLTMLQYFVKVTDVDGPYWTLAQELAFYFLMVAVMSTRMTKRIEAVSAVWLGIGVLYALVLHEGLIGFHARLQTVLGARYCHLFVAGMMFYRLRTVGHAWHRHLLILMVALYELGQGTRESFVVVALLLSVFYAVIWGKLRFVTVRPLLFLGSVSYALYAIHGSTGRAALLALHRHGWGSLSALTVTIPGLVVLAWAITAFIERPMIRWVNRQRLRLTQI